MSKVHQPGSVWNNVLQLQSLRDAFLFCLSQNKIKIPQTLLERNVTQADAASSEVQTQLIEVFRSSPVLAQLCELLVDLDEGLQEWRYRHVKMVERTIGTKRGTGDSMGAEYLKKTLFQPIFPDLWAIRAEL